MDLFCKEIWRRRRKWWGLVNCENDDEEEIEEENVLLPWCFCYVLGFIHIFFMPLLKRI